MDGPLDHLDHLDHLDNLDILHHLDHSDQSNHSDNPKWSMINQKDNCRIRIVYLVLFTLFSLKPRIHLKKLIFFVWICCSLLIQHVPILERANTVPTKSLLKKPQQIDSSLQNCPTIFSKKTFSQKFQTLPCRGTILHWVIGNFWTGARSWILLWHFDGETYSRLHLLTPGFLITQVDWNFNEVTH